MKLWSCACLHFRVIVNLGGNFKLTSSNSACERTTDMESVSAAQGSRAAAVTHVPLSKNKVRACRTRQESAINTGNHPCAHGGAHVRTHSDSETRGSASPRQREVASLMAADMVRFPSLGFLSQDSFQAKALEEQL